MGGRKSGDSLRLRVSVEEKTALEDMLLVEGGSMTELLVEGVWRVVSSRSTPRDPEAAPIVRPKQSRADEALQFRGSDAELTALAVITSKEDCKPASLIGEGIWHVIHDREQDPQYQERAERIRELLGQVEATRAELHQSQEQAPPKV